MISSRIDHEHNAVQSEKVVETEIAGWFHHCRDVIIR